MKRMSGQVSGTCSQPATVPGTGNTRFRFPDSEFRATGAGSEAEDSEGETRRSEPGTVFMLRPARMSGQQTAALPSSTRRTRPGRPAVAHGPRGPGPPVDPSPRDATAPGAAAANDCGPPRWTGT